MLERDVFPANNKFRHAFSFLIFSGVVASVGLSSLQFVDMNSSRNLVVVGCSLFAGLSVPHYVNSTPDAINTGKDRMSYALVKYKTKISQRMVAGPISVRGRRGQGRKMARFGQKK